MKKSKLLKRTRFKKKVTKKKLLKICKLRDKVWKEFSKYIRLKDAVNGYVKCVTCGKVIQAYGKGECEAGHFFHGKDREFYFDEDNVHPQCTSCNNYHKDVAGKKYVLFMLDEYGQATVDRLLNSRKIIWKRAYLDEKLEYYTRKAKEVE